MRSLGHRGSDDGAVAVTVAIVLLVLFLVTALVVDLGFTRSDARANQTHADFAVLAGASFDGTAREQCRRAVEYFAVNAPEVTEPVDASPCDDLPEDCNATTPSRTTDPISAGPYQLFVTHPVDDDDPAMTAGGQTVQERDRERCDRIKTEVRRDRAYIFAPAAGMFDGVSFGDAVALRETGGGEDAFASLIVLEQTGCRAIRTTGGGQVRVNNNNVDGIDYPGLIAVDTSATDSSGCSDNPNSRALITSGSNPRIQAEGGILAFRYPHPDGHHVNPTVIPDEIGVSVSDRATRITRRSVDWLANCQATYPAYNTSGNQRYPFYGDWSACPDAGDPNRGPFVDQLEAALQTNPLPSGDAPWHVIDTCANSTRLHHDGTTQGRFVHVTCGTPAGVMVFEDVTHVVFDNNAESMTRLVVKAPEALSPGATEGAVVYFRNGGVRNTSSSDDELSACDAPASNNRPGACFENVFVYVNAATDHGVRFNGGDVEWSSVPRPPGGGPGPGCGTVNSVPTAACLAPLALWSNTTATHDFGGNGTQRIVGSYFMPNSTASLNGGSDINLEDAQFYANRFLVTGGGELTLRPHPSTSIPDPFLGPALIR